MIYEYVAVDKTGTKNQGAEEADTERELAAFLRSKNLLLIESHVKGSVKKRNVDIMEYLWRFQKVNLIEKINFAKNLSVMIGAGVSLTRALDAMGNQTTNFKFKRVIADVLENITQGKSFSESLKPHSKIFSDIFVNMIGAAEVSGKLEKTLLLLSRQMKRDYDLRSRVRGAMMYPAIILCVLVLIGVLMMAYVVPTLASTFKDLKAELPLSTKILMATSDYLMNYYYIIAPCFAAFIFLFYRVIKTKTGKAIFDRVVLKFPVFGTLIKKFNTARFARTLASLIASGVAITKALEITSGVLGNVLFKAAIAQAAQDIQKGKPFNETLKRYPELFEPMFTQTIEVGEETGTISRMLFRIAIFYEQEVNETTKNLSTIIEPLLMVFIGAVVAVFAVSIIQPIYTSLNGI